MVPWKKVPEMVAPSADSSPTIRALAAAMVKVTSSPDRVGRPAPMPRAPWSGLSITARPSSPTRNTSVSVWPLTVSDPSQVPTSRAIAAGSGAAVWAAAWRVRTSGAATPPCRRVPVRVRPSADSAPSKLPPMAATPSRTTPPSTVGPSAGMSKPPWSGLSITAPVPSMRKTMRIDWPATFSRPSQAPVRSGASAPAAGAAITPATRTVESMVIEGSPSRGASLARARVQRQAVQKGDQPGVDLVRPLLLKPVAGAGQHMGPAEIFKPVAQRRLLRPGVQPHRVVLADHEQGRRGDLPVLQPGGQGPVAVHAPVPVQRSLEAPGGEGRDVVGQVLGAHPRR